MSVPVRDQAQGKLADQEKETLKLDEHIGDRDMPGHCLHGLRIPHSHKS